MYKNGLALISLVALVLSSCVTVPPSQTGAMLYDRDDFAGAYSELAPLAEQGDAIAQYFVARMSLSGETATGLNADDALGMLVNSAKQGNTDAYGLLLLMKMDPQQREQFRNYIDASAPLPARLGDGATSGRIQRMKADLDKTGDIAEAVAGGPVSPGALLAMIEQADFIETWPGDHQALLISDDTLISIDEARAKVGSKFAQLRLAIRYADGRGVEKNEKKAFDLFLSAAKRLPAPRSCVYQAPVGGGSGSTYCYDAGAETPGLPRAMLEVCRAYATGAGVEKDMAKARTWCERAAQSPEAGREAREILRRLS